MNKLKRLILENVNKQKREYSCLPTTFKEIKHNGKTKQEISNELVRSVLGDPNVVYDDRPLEVEFNYIKPQD